MASKNLVSNLKVIASGNTPTTSQLANGEFAFGIVDGVARLFGNVGGTIYEFSLVRSVAGKTGNVTLAKGDVGLTNVDNVKQYSESNPPQKVVGSYEQLEDGTYNLIIGLTGDAPSAAAITQINGEDLAGKEFYDYVHTVGAVIFSFNDSFSPSALWGGSWSRVTNRFLIGSGGTYSTGVTGGETSVTLTVNQMPSHTHSIESPMQSWGHLRQDGDQNIWILGDINQQKINPTGGGQPHNNMPPYIGCNIWRKIA